jgi:hypothetical protein
MDQSKELISWLIKQDVETVKAWIYEAWEGLQSVPGDFKWEYLAATLEVLARSGNGPNYYSKPDLEWGKLTVSIYHYLISKADPLTRMSLEERMMYLKAYLISYYGCIAGNAFLDVNRIVDWFFQNVRLSIDEVEKRLAHLKDLEMEELMFLRHLKVRLSIIQFLSDRNLIFPNEILRKWLAIQTKLP